ncbi:MAG: universal stress protein [Adhaeribacter sp.]
MKTMKTILVPTDFSPNAETALHYAAGLAAALRGKIILAHVINLPVTLPAYPEASLDLANDPQLEEEATASLKELARKTRIDGGFLFDLETVCQTGALLPVLNELVEKNEVDLVVMGTRGAGKFLDKLLGTNTSLYMKAAHCPVLAIPEQATYSRWHQLAFAAELEEDESIFLQQLFYLAEPFGAHVSVVHVQTGSVEDSRGRRADELHQRFAGHPYQFVQLQGQEVVATLESYVKAQNPDLLAVGLRERNLLEGLFHRSVSKQLVYHPARPLLALPARPYRVLQHKLATPPVRKTP